jgi:Abnormal spindle-like microcephaly-assoc'd, ASPM-SPD-2-Hydin
MGRRRWTFAAGIATTVALALPSGALAATASPDSLAFGSVRVGTTSAPQTTTVSGAVTGAPTVSGAGFAITEQTCPPPPLGTCTVSVTFTPTAAGPASGTLTVPGLPSDATVALSGTGTEPVAVLDQPTAFGFGAITVGQKSGGISTKVRNGGSAPLTISSIVLGGANPGDFALGYCTATPITLMPGQECFVAALFQPASAGDKGAAITVTHDAAGGSLTIPLAGTGVAPPPPTTPGAPAPPTTVDVPGGASTITGAPIVKIASPKRNASVTRFTKVRRKRKLVTIAKAVTFKGTASDTDGLARVEVALVKGSSVPASPAYKRAKLDDFAWSHTVPAKEKLKAGTYTLVARATDVRGVRSAPVSVTFKLK